MYRAKKIAGVVFFALLFFQIRAEESLDVTEFYEEFDTTITRAPRPNSGSSSTASQVSINPSAPVLQPPMPRDLNARKAQLVTLGVSSVATFNNPIVAPGVANDFIIAGTLVVQGDLDVTGNLNITGTVNFNNVVTTTSSIQLSAVAGQSACFIFEQTDPNYEKGRICSNPVANQAGLTISVGPSVTNSIIVDTNANTTITGFLTGNKGSQIGACGTYATSNLVQVGTPSTGTTDASTWRQVHTVLQSLVATSGAQVDGSMLQVHVFPVASFAAGAASSGFFITNLRNTDKSLASASATVLGMADIPSASSINTISMGSRLATSMLSIYTNSSFTSLTAAQQTAATTLITGLGYTINNALVFVIVYNGTPATYSNFGIMQTFAVG